MHNAPRLPDYAHLITGHDLAVRAGWASGAARLNTLHKAAEEGVEIVRKREAEGRFVTIGDVLVVLVQRFTRDLAHIRESDRLALFSEAARRAVMQAATLPMDEAAASAKRQADYARLYGTHLARLDGVRAYEGDALETATEDADRWADAWMHADRASAHAERGEAA